MTLLYFSMSPEGSYHHTIGVRNVGRKLVSAGSRFVEADRLPKVARKPKSDDDTGCERVQLLHNSTLGALTISVP